MASPLGGWYLNGSTLEYRLFKEDGVTLSTNVLAKITGLNVKGSGTDIQVKKSDGAWVALDESYISITDEVQDPETKKCTGTIQLTNLILGQKDVVLTNNSLTGYKGAFTIGIPDGNKVQIAKAGDKSSEYLSYDSKNGKILVKADLTAGFTVNSTTKATYKNASPDTTLATISGLRKLATSATTEAIETYEGSASLSNEALDDTTFDKKGVVTLSKVDVGGESTDTTSEGSVLGTTDISIAASDVAKANGISYTLDLNQSKKGKYGYAQAGLDEYEAEAYWTYSGTTASYKIDSPTGYELTDNNNATVSSGATKIKVTASKSTTVVTVNGLAKDLDVSEDGKSIGTYTFSSAGTENAEFKEGLTVNEIGSDEHPTKSGNTTTKGKVTVNIKDNNVITNTTVSLSSSSYTPKFGTVTNVLEKEQIKDIWEIDGSKAYLRRVRRAWYKPDDADAPAKLTYGGQTTLYTFLTITGLSAEGLDKATKTYESDKYEPKIITAIDGLTVTGTLSDLVTESTDKGLKKYTKNANATDLGITISTALLDNTTAKIGNSDKFKIKLADDVAAPTFSDMQWNVESNGTKAILKGDITKGYVVKSDGKSVTYTKSGDNQTLATITNLKKGTKLTVDATTGARTVGFGGGSSFKQGLSLATNDALSSNRPVDFSTVAGLSDAYNRQSIIVSKNVIDTSKVQINSSFFDLELDNTNNIGGSVPTATTSDQPYWTLGTTAYLKKNASPYYSLANNHLSIDYKTATTSSNKADTITTVKGLNANVTVEDLVVDGTTIKVNANALDNKNVTITNPTNATDKYKLQLVGGSAPTIESPEWKQTGNTVTYAADVKSGYRTSNDGSAIIYNPTKETTLFTITGLRSGVGTVDGGGLSGITLDTDARTVELSYGVLNNANVTLKSDYGYDLLVNSDIKTVAPGSTASIASWAIDGTTATYKAIIPAYYEYDADKETLVYKKFSDAKEGNKTVTYAKITGLNKGLFVSEDGQSIGYYKDDGAFVAGLSAAGTGANLITIKDAGILSTVAAKLDNAAIAAGYSLALDSTLENNIKPQFVDNFSDTNATWTVKGTTAYLLGGVSKGYVTSEDKHSILYYAGNDTAATIATVKNLPSGLTTKKVTAEGGLAVAGHSITVGKDVLATNTKLSLTTNIPVGNENYYFALADDVTDYNDAVSSLQKVWTIKDSTATYRGSIGSAYYGVVGSASDSISYNAAGLPDDLQYAKLEGLASNLVTIQGGAIKGISVAELAQGNDFNHKIELSSNVLKAASVTLTDLDTTDTLTFGLSTAEDYSPKDAAGFKVTSAGNLDLFNGKTSGYTLSGTSSLVYESIQGGSGDVQAKISGLASTFKSSGTAVSPSTEKVYETLDGISVDYDNKVVTLSKDILGSTSVVLTNQNSNTYKLALDSDVATYSAGAGWVKGTADGQYVLYSGTSKGGFSLAGDSLSVKMMAGGGTGGTSIGTISGLKKDLTINDKYQIAGISFGDDKKIYLSQNVLDGKDVTITLNSAGNGYKLALNSDQDDEAAYVAAPVTTNLWTLNNGTATYEQKTTAGYTTDGDTTIKYTKAQTITTKIDNLSKEFVKVTEESERSNKLEFTGAVAAAESGNASEGGDGNVNKNEPTSVNEAISFKSSTGKFTINYADVLAHKDSSIKVSYTGLTNEEKDAHKYTLDLAEGIAAEAYDPVWVKSNKETTAKLNQTTAAGYTLALDGSKVTYSSDPTTKTLATISNLKRDVALKENGELEGTSTSTYGLSYANVPASSGADPGTIKVYKGVLDVLSGSNTVKLADSDKFEFALDTEVPGEAKDDQYAFTVSGTKAIYKKGKSAYYTTSENKKQIAYTPADMNTEEFTIEGLKSGTKANADGSITGIDVNGTSVTLSQAVLDKSKVSLTTSGSYVLALGDDVHDYSKTTDSDWKDQTEWISSGSTYTYKTYDKASYELYTDTQNQTTNQRSITYHGETSGTEHAKITGLKSGLTITIATDADDTGKIYKPNDFNNPDLGGTITLSDNELNKAKVTLTTKGDTKIKLALDSTDATLEAKATPDSSWTTSGTKATLGGTLSKGYTVSEDEKSITYNSAKKSQTFATITGIKSGAKIKSTDVTTADGVTTVKLGADQVGTSDIKITGDGYKLAVDNDIRSTTDDPKWIKTAGTNKATFTETTYNGFKVENSGKTLKYYKNTTNDDLITINGLKSDLVADSGKITGVNFGDGDNDKVITLSADALAKSNVSLTSKEGDYSLALSDADANKLKVKGTIESKISYNTFKDGTLSRVTGITEGWTRESPTLIKYTAPKIDTLVTISGLNKAATFTEDLADPTKNEIAGVTFDEGSNTFKLSKTALSSLTDGKSVTLTNKTVNGTASTFKLALDDSATGDEAVSAPQKGDNELALSGTTAYLKATTTEGYTVGNKNGNPTITYSAKKVGETLATITGLPSGCKLEQDDNGKNIITLDGEKVLYYENGSQVQVNSTFFNNYKKAITLKIVDTKSGFGASFNDITVSEAGGSSNYDDTTFSNGTMTYKKTTSAGWVKIEGNNGVTTYQYMPTEVKTIATVNGLNPTVTKVGDDNGINVENDGTHVVIVGPNALNNKKVTISVPNGSTNKYTLAIEDDVWSEDNENTKASWQNQVEWVMSNGTASYKLYDKGHYKVTAVNNNGVNTIDYTAANAGTTYASITGLTKTATIDSNDVNENGVITLTSTDLGASTVKLTTATVAKATTTITSDEGVLNKIAKAPNFILDLKAGDVDESKVKDAAWDTTGNTAKLVGTVTKGYVLSTDKKSVTYQAADQDGKEIAKITGLRSGAEVTANDVSDTSDTRVKAVKLDAYDLGTGNVAITGAGYKLALDEKVIKSADVDEEELANGGWSGVTDWTASNGTFTYKTYNKANWELNDTGTSVKYTAAKDVTNGTKLTITGLNPDIITQDVDRYISDSNASAIVDIKENMVVALGASALNRKTITLSDKSGDGYTLADISTNKSKASNLTGVVSGSKVTVRGTQSQGYLLSNDSQKLTYYAKATTQDVAVINGLASTTYAASLKGSGAVNLEFNADNNTFNLKDRQLSNSVTVSGSARFSFDNSYTGEKKIFGTSNSENIQVAGSGLTVNAGSGNDYIDLNSTSGNTVIYGGGNDVIANFTAGTDTFKANIDVGNGANLKFEADNNGDAILKIGSNKVRFKELAGTEFSILDKSGKDENKVTHYTTASGSVNVLADDNYSTTPQLSSIVNNSSGYMTTDDLTATDATSLTKQNTAIAYSGKK